MLERLLVDYTAAGFDPLAFWGLTPRLFDLHMQGAKERLARELEISNRHAYSTAALAGASFAGKLPAFDKAFGKKLRSAGKQQSVEVMEASLRVLATAWGAISAPQ